MLDVQFAGLFAGLRENPMALETLRSVIAPQVGAIVLLLLLWRPWRKNAPAPLPIVTALSLGAAFIAAQLIAHGWHGWYPGDTTRRIVYAALFAIAIAGVETWPKLPNPARHALRLLGSVAIVWMLTAHRRRNGDWSGGEIWLWTALWSAIVMLWTTCANNLASRRPGPAWPMLLSILALGLSLTAFKAGAASFSQLAGLLVAWMHGVFVLALIWKKLDLTRGAATVFGLGAGGLLVLTYTGVWPHGPRWGVGLLAVAPLLLLTPRLPRVRTMKPLAQFGIAAVMLAIAAAGAVALATYVDAEDAGDTNDGSDLYGHTPTIPAPATPTLA